MKRNRQHFVIITICKGIWKKIHLISFPSRAKLSRRGTSAKADRRSSSSPSMCEILLSWKRLNRFVTKQKCLPSFIGGFKVRQSTKDAGFVYESLRIETNRVIWDFCFHETNPRYESLRFGFANPDSRICNFRIRKDSDSQVSIFKDSFRAIVLRIRKDS